MDLQWDHEEKNKKEKKNPNIKKNPTEHVKSTVEKLF